jgi:UDP-GlcNAc:undecaprenyl-phosphate GlcNAc-1-phosphate transferase
MYLSLVAAFAAALLLTPLVRICAARVGRVAHPRADRWHSKPVALMGGIAIGLSTAVAFGIAVWRAEPGLGFPRYLTGILASSVIMFVIGLVDDIRSLKPNTKLILEAAAAAVLVSSGAVYQIAPFTLVNVVFTMFWFIALTNAMNLLDNMDGITAGTAAIVALGFAALFRDSPLLAALPLAVAGACIGFLIFNFSPASIFMGDAGSLFLGAALAGLGATYSNTRSGANFEAVLLPMVLVLVPIVDTALVMSTRLLARRPVTVGGRDHVTHRLAFIGLKDWQVAVGIYAVAAAATLLAVNLSDGFNPVTAVTAILFFVAVLVVARYLAKLPIHPIPAPTKVSHLSMLIDELLYNLRILDAMVDLVVFAAAYWGAYLLRWGGAPPPPQSKVLMATLAVVAAVRLASFYGVGIYRGVWHQVSVRDVHRLLRAVLIGTLANFLIVVVFLRHTEVGGSVFVIDGMLVLLFTFGLRLSYRSLDVMRNQLARPGSPTLIFGVGKGGELTMRELSANRDYGLTPVGFLDDDPRKKGKIVFGLPVFGGRDAIATLVETRNIERMVIGSQMLGADAVRELQDCCDEVGVELLQLRFHLTPVNGNNGNAQRMVAGMKSRSITLAPPSKEKRDPKIVAALDS